MRALTRTHTKKIIYALDFSRELIFLTKHSSTLDFFNLFIAEKIHVEYKKIL